MKHTNKKLTSEEKKLNKIYKIFLIKLYISYFIVGIVVMVFYILFSSIVFDNVSEPPPQVILFFIILLAVFFTIQVIFSNKWLKHKKISLGRFFIYNIAIAILCLSLMINILNRNIFLFEAVNIDLFLTMMLMALGVLLATLFFTIFSRPIYAVKLEPSLSINFVLKVIPIIIFSILFFFLIIRGSMYKSQVEFSKIYELKNRENTLIFFTEKINNLIENTLESENTISILINTINKNRAIPYQNGAKLIIDDYIREIYNNENNDSIESISIYLDEASTIMGNSTYGNDSLHMEWDMYSKNEPSLYTNPTTSTQSNIAQNTEPYIELKYNYSKSSMLNIYSPILIDNEVVGTILFKLANSSITKILDSMNIGQNVGIIILNNDNILAYSYNEINEIAKDIETLKYPQSRNSDWGNILNKRYIRLNNKTMLSDILDYTKNNNKFRLLKSSSDNLDFNILFIWKATTVQDSIQSRYFVEASSIISLIALIVITIIIFFIMKMHQNIILKIGRTTALLAKFGGDLTQRVVIRSNDETGILAYGLNKFLERISSIIEATKKNTSKISECFDVTDSIISENYASSDKAVKEFESEIQTIEKVSNLVKNASIVSNSQRRQFGSVNDSIQTLLKTVSNINNSMEDQASAINETSASIHQMMSNIASVAQSAHQVNQFSQNLVSDAKNGSDIGEEVMEAIQHIREASLQITDITKVIQVISEQTNLLAMNAAIEAAHAGEQGKGFAIVADKIRKLAEDTGENSKIIGGIVQDVTDSIEHTVSLATQSSDSLDKILDSSTSVASLISEITNANGELDLGRRDILSVLKNLNQITFAVQNLSNEQTEISNKVSSQISSVDKLAEDVGIAVENVNTETTELLKSIESVSELVSYSKEQVNNLEASIEIMRKIFYNIDNLVNMFTTDSDLKEEDRAIGISTKNTKRSFFDRLKMKLRKKYDKN